MFFSFSSSIVVDRYHHHKGDSDNLFNTDDEHG